MDTIKITEKSAEVFNYVKGNGGRVSVEEICEATLAYFAMCRWQ